MLNPVYRTATFLCQLVARLPIGTNLGLAHLLWTLLSGHFLPSRGAVFPALQNAGIADKEARQAEASLREGKWDVRSLLRRFGWLIRQEQHTKRVCIGQWRPLLIDWVGFFRPRLSGCSSKHYDSAAGKALPAIELGMVATVGQIRERTIPVLVELNRSGDTLSLLQLARTKQGCRDVLVADRQVKMSHLEEAGLRHFVIRVGNGVSQRAQQNLAARRSEIMSRESGKRGRKPTRGEMVRPLARHYKGKILGATPPDREENFVENGRPMEAKWFDKIVVAGSSREASCLVIKDPRYKNEWVLLTDLSDASAETVYRLYCSRWKIEQLPLTGKQILGGHRSFVHAATSRYRLPEICLLCASVSLYLSATCEAIATGFWDRHPKRTPGRYRRVLFGAKLPQFREFTVGYGRVREKHSIHEHLSKGIAGHCRQVMNGTPPSFTGN